MKTETMTAKKRMQDVAATATATATALYIGEGEASAVWQFSEGKKCKEKNVCVKKQQK